VPSAWTVVDSLDDTTAPEVDGLLASIERLTGDEAFSESGAELCATGSIRHALRHHGGALTGYGVVPHGPRDDAEPAIGTFDQEFARLFEATGAPASMLLRGVEDDEEVERLVERGWRLSRRVDRLRRPLPADPAPPTAFVVRPFEPGRDEAAWVAGNNAAFAGHPTQGAMTVGRLEAKERAAWFDPSGFLLFFDGDRLAASCWTKVHDRAAGRMGEIYVISVAPFAQGSGLGRIAVLRGLEHLAQLGLGIAELYVEADNLDAYRLYESIGFTYSARVLELRIGVDDEVAGRSTG
jgi:mycothiol synthase